MALHQENLHRVRAHRARRDSRRAGQPLARRARAQVRALPSHLRDPLHRLHHAEMILVEAVRKEEETGEGERDLILQLGSVQTCVGAGYLLVAPLNNRYLNHVFHLKEAKKILLFFFYIM